MIHIRKATSKDLSILQKLFVETINQVCQVDYSSEQIQVWTAGVHKASRWNELFTKQYVLVAEIASEVVGFASLDQGDYIDFLYVHKAHQRKGVAKSLYQELEKEANRLGYFKLRTHASKTALSFFQAFGFHLVLENKQIIDGVEIVNYYMEQ